jgi:protein gp37
MSDKSKIEWTDATWNPIRGCTKVSPGCAHCYAETFAERFRGVPGHPYEHGFDLRVVREKLDEPLGWKKPRRIFVNSMSDLFHDEVPTAFIKEVFDVMRRAHWHQFQLLTKRPERALSLKDDLQWAPNIWFGVSVESERYLSRVDRLRETSAAVKFLSLEPLLGALPTLDLLCIDWVIVGGESGAGARPMRSEWVHGIRDRCVAESVPFFFKQWGAFGDDGKRRPKKRNGRLLEGRTWDEWPDHIKNGVCAS